MVSVNDSYSGDHLKCEDLKGREVTLTIASVSLEKVGDDQKLVAYFRGTKRDLVLNKTNASAIAQMYGDETDHWMGRTITLIPTQTDYQGKIVPAIRVKLLTPIEAGVPGVQVTPAPAPDNGLPISHGTVAANPLPADPRPAVPATGPADDDLDDVIPFIIWRDHRFDKSIRA